jgi:Na+/H+ antiporter NhaC
MLLVVLFAFFTMFGAAEGEEAVSSSNLYATFWSLLPPIIAIVLALITKEVYSSLFIGILAGGLLYANFSPAGTIVAVTEVLTEKISDPWNAGILIFLVMLGIMVSLMNKAGGSAAYGRWAAQRISSKKGALFSTFGLGVLIFVDDYFNCLTVGSVMVPVTDKHKISRAKLSYIIDATAAPICIIAPISSWAAAVSSSVTDEIDGFSVFLQSIPYNLYALLTIAMIIMITAMGLDYGPMKRYERLAEQTGDLFGGNGNEYATEAQKDNPKGKVIDLVLPVLVLIASCIICMVYTGGFFDGLEHKGRRRVRVFIGIEFNPAFPARLYTGHVGRKASGFFRQTRKIIVHLRFPRISLEWRSRGRPNLPCGRTSSHRP